MAISEWETRIPGDICAGKHESLGICVCGEIFKKSLWETHITDSFWWETRIPSDMCAGKHGSLGICVRETRYPGKHIVTPGTT